MSLSRRRVLQLSASTAAGLTTAARTTRTAQSTGPNWAPLRARLAGRLLLDGDAGYEQVRLPFNQVYRAQRPDAIARCLRSSDVQACLDFAARNRFPVAARSGGHSYRAYCTPQDALVVDLERMDSVHVRADGTAVVGAGARMIDMYEVLAKHGRAVPGGTCPTVGIAGLTLGGGLGVLMRKYGLTCDRLAEAQLVTPDSTLCTVSPSARSDLYWALRGGGGGNFGITTSFTFDTVPAPELLTVFSLTFPEGSATDVFGAWQDWIRASPRELWSNISVLGGPSPAATVPGCLLGPAAEARAHIAELERRAGVTATQYEVLEKDYLGAMLYWAGCSDVDGCHLPPGGEVPRRRFVAASRVLERRLTEPGELTSLVTGDTTVALEVNPLDAAVADLGDSDTAFPHRSDFADVQVYLSLADEDDPEAAKDEVERIQRSLAAVATGGAYVNYLNDRQDDWKSAYYGANLNQLRRIAEHYDPDGVLWFEQGLSPSPP